MKFIFAPLALGLALGCATRDPAPKSPAAAESNHTVVQFTTNTDLAAWAVEDDIVMGGRSRGEFVVNDAGNAVFSGAVSLENDSGFSSVQHDFPTLDVSKYRAICLGLRGDGKRYQLRLEAQPGAPRAYAADFQTGIEWEIIELPFANFYPIHHGDRLDLPNFPGRTLARIQILIGNNVAETFRLEIDRIWLK